MTLKEADNVAKKRLPVVFDDGLHEHAEYTRITEIGYRYDDSGTAHPFVQLLGRSNNSVTYADPAHCSLIN